MPKTSLTAVSVERLTSPKVGQIEYYDRLQPGFGLRVSYRGAKSWFMMTRVDGKLVRLTLGKYPALSLHQARDSARLAFRHVAEGRDPRSIKQEDERLKREAASNTFAACAAEFLTKHAERRLRPSTQNEYRRVLTGKDTQAWRELPVSKITKRHVVEVIESIDERGSPGAAKRSLVYLRKFFNWCAQRDLLEATPTARIAAPHPEVRRDRVLSAVELRYLIAAVEEEDSLFAPAIRLLLLTGQRRAEVAGMRWSELRDLEGEEALWEIPGHRTKNGQTHLVPITAAVKAALNALPRAVDLVFTTTGKTPVSGFGKAKARIDQRIASLRAADAVHPMPPWTFHDLRRTMVTVMNEQLHILPHVVEAVVNHTSGMAKAGVAGVYNRATYLDERRRALTLWADFVKGLSKQPNLP